jgi:hypothetical protein
MVEPGRPRARVRTISERLGGSPGSVVRILNIFEVKSRGLGKRR